MWDLVIGGKGSARMGCEDFVPLPHGLVLVMVSISDVDILRSFD